MTDSWTQKMHGNTMPVYTYLNFIILSSNSDISEA